ncbi:DUF4112 domain-containing protein [Prevotella sp. P6B4]|uniref:DUF4112 domain-containing protein n=1 Tax=Prevotella sp. P6B4 TaxID=1410614 RepID=UPI00048E08E9|nr:DUF4112 domain-containing protein [Prevotella sp. P6B4]
MDKDEKRLLQRKRLMDNKIYQTMNDITRYMDRYYLDAVIGIIPGWGDVITMFCVVPFIYFSTRVIKSIPLTLAIINNALRDVLLGMIPFFIGDVIDVFHRANTKNMAMIQGFVDGNVTVTKEVNQKAIQSAVILIILLILIALMIWALASFGSHLYSLIT